MGGNTQRALNLVKGGFVTYTPDDGLWIDPFKLEKQVETRIFQNFLASHLLSSAKVSRWLPLILKTWRACALHFRKFSSSNVLKLKTKKRNSFG